MSSYIKEIHINPWGEKSTTNGNCRPSNYVNAYDERNRDSYHPKNNHYIPKHRPSVTILDDPLSYDEGGFRPGASFTSEDWKAMRSGRVITEGTIFKQKDRNGSLRIWRMVTVCDTFGNRYMKRVRMVSL